MADVSVVVPARDAAGSLPALLGSLADQTLPAERFEVLVVDNASRDDTAAVAERGGARVVEEPVPGRARARNAGVRAAHGRLIAFVDADCEAASGWLEALCGCLERTALAAGPVRLRHGEPPNGVEQLELLWRFRQEEHVRAEGWAASANLGIRREAFESLGGFDEDFTRIGEDVDLCLRARAAGYGLGFCPGAVIAHPVEDRLGTLLRRAFAHGWSNVQLLHRHPAPGRRAYWRHPGPLVRGDWALRRFGDEAARGADRLLLRLARLEYAARMAGSAWAAARRVR